MLVDWATQVLSESHRDAAKFQTEAIHRLKGDHERIQRRLDTMYIQMLEGRISAADYDRRANAWNAELLDFERKIKERETAASSNHLLDAIDLNSRKMRRISLQGSQQEKKPGCSNL
jgi:hypothetical protein